PATLRARSGSSQETESPGESGNRFVRFGGFALTSSNLPVRRETAKLAAVGSDSFSEVAGAPIAAAGFFIRGYQAH
ncbi:hypothetical protein, partial [Streptomonospora halophila]|uniref:hypothetical protein n=1 Tax=Streptomonospora halophila TaxID=427369 RepID=UPI0031EE7459